MITQSIINHYISMVMGLRSLTHEYIADNLWRSAMINTATLLDAWRAQLTGVQLIFNGLQPGNRAGFVEISSRRAADADRANDLIAHLNRHSAS